MASKMIQSHKKNENGKDDKHPAVKAQMWFKCLSNDDSFEWQ